MSEEEQDPLATPLAPVQPVPVLVPRCPYCSVQPCNVHFGTAAWQLGTGQQFIMAAIYCCTNCQCILSISALQAGQQPQAGGRRIMVPQ